VAPNRLTLFPAPRGNAEPWQGLELLDAEPAFRAKVLIIHNSARPAGTAFSDRVPILPLGEAKQLAHELVHGLKAAVERNKGGEKSHAELLVLYKQVLYELIPKYGFAPNAIGAAAMRRTLNKYLELIPLVDVIHKLLNTRPMVFNLVRSKPSLGASAAEKRKPPFSSWAASKDSDATSSPADVSGQSTQASFVATPPSRKPPNPLEHDNDFSSSAALAKKRRPVARPDFRSPLQEGSPASQPALQSTELEEALLEPSYGDSPDTGGWKFNLTYEGGATIQALRKHISQKLNVAPNRLTLFPAPRGNAEPWQGPELLDAEPAFRARVVIVHESARPAGTPCSMLPLGEAKQLAHELVHDLKAAVERTKGGEKSHAELLALYKQVQYELIPKYGFAPNIAGVEAMSRTLDNYLGELIPLGEEVHKLLKMRPMLFNLSIQK